MGVATPTEREPKMEGDNTRFLSIGTRTGTHGKHDPCSVHNGTSIILSLSDLWVGIGWIEFSVAAVVGITREHATSKLTEGVFVFVYIILGRAHDSGACVAQYWNLST